MAAVRTPCIWRLLSLLVGALALSMSAQAQTDVLIVYPVPEEATGGLVNARHLEALLGHFPGVRARSVSIDEYVIGSSGDVDLAVFIGSPIATPGETIVADLARAQRLCWLGAGAGRLLDHLDAEARSAVAVDGEGARPSYFQVFYKDAVLRRGSPFMTELTTLDADKVTVWAEVSDGSRRRPYALRTGALWLFADNPLAYFGSRDRYLVFADLLHEVLGLDHPVEHSAIIRIADVSPMTEPRHLNALARIFDEEGIPFLVSVVPHYVDPDREVSLSLEERPELVRALTRMQEIGGSMVLHGAVHRYRGKTLEDLEFWDREGDRPLPVDNAEFVQRKIDAAAGVLTRLGLVPRAWETPGHAASELDYQVFASAFSTAIEARMATDTVSAAFSVPFVVERDRFGQRLLPDNLGYLRADVPDVDSVLDSAGVVRVIRDGVASVQFHPFVDSSALRKLIRGLRNRGYSFLDLRRLVGEETRRYEAAAVAKREPATEDGAALEASGSRVHSSASWAARFLRRFSRRGARPSPIGAALLWDDSPGPALEAEQTGFRVALEASGLAVDTLPIAAAGGPGDDRLLVAPGVAAAKLTPTALDEWLRAVRNGAVLVTSGASPLSRSLGVDFGDVANVRELEDLLHEPSDIRWTAADDIATLELPSEGEVLLRDSATGRPVAVAGSFGEGRYVAFAGPFSETGSGYDRYPALPHYLHRLGISPRLRSTTLEVFFDPGLREDVSVEELADLWRGRGVRVVHAAAWHFYGEYDFDYSRLLSEAHRAGILVYAWFEPPQVTPDFWLERPECREKNYLGEDVRPDWRYPVALVDDECRRLALTEYARVLDAFDWDGVNFAELSFFAAGGFADTENLTPFHPSAVKLFESLHGFDPALLFVEESEYYYKRNPAAVGVFGDFRIDWIVRLHEELLEVARTAAAKRPLGFETVLTLLDSLAAPELKADLGLDVAQILELMADYEFSVAVEDPKAMWLEPPDRYEVIAERYRDLGVAASRLLIDINVLEFRSAGDEGYVTRQQTGVELQELARSSAMFTPRTLIYAESTLYERDAELLPSALASRASLVEEAEGWRVRSPHQVALEVGPSVDDVQLDGVSWPVRDRNYVLLPAGDHLVTTSSQGIGRWLWGRNRPRPSVLGCTGEIRDARRTQEGLELEYDSLTRVALTVSARPGSVTVDGEPFDARSFESGGNVVLFLPAGRHKVTLGDLFNLSDSVESGLYHLGHFLLTLIALFGVAACVALLVALASSMRVSRGVRGH